MKKWILGIIAAYFLLLCFVYLEQRGLIYHPRSGDMSPKVWGLKQVRLVTIQTSDGLSLKAWYSPAKNNKPTILYLHGNYGHLGHRAGRIKPYIKAGFGVLLLSYRGFSGNKGQPTEQGLYLDARAAIQYLNLQGVSSNCIVLLGESLGTGVAVKMAEESQVGAVILRSPYTSLVEVAKNRYPIFPVSLMLKDRFESIKRIKNVYAPALFIHGKKDRVIPLSQGEALYLAANEPKVFKLYPRAGHNNLPSLGPEVIGFLKKYAVCHSI